MAVAVPLASALIPNRSQKSRLNVSGNVCIESDLVRPTGMVSPACTLLVKNNDGIPRLSANINFFIRCYKIVKYIKL
ncbi:hypothetical protein C3415_13100 [Acinetobacter baumannii]|nr:hypothetical protein [Acinetobacter baumannii]POZ07161.1 hypothetical protein C3415_13100 [Acinetobacter baumannii]TPU52060.1 hypothetical protein FJV29_18125 [Acinetobacter baumannii]HAV5013951.1 hypothetical protein [Acinetobacter baumannii]